MRAPSPALLALLRNISHMSSQYSCKPAAATAAAASVPADVAVLQRCPCAQLQLLLGSGSGSDAADIMAAALCVVMPHHQHITQPQPLLAGFPGSASALSAAQDMRGAGQKTGQEQET